jgi:hypothetical protein
MKRERGGGRENPRRREGKGDIADAREKRREKKTQKPNTEKQE